MGVDSRFESMKRRINEGVGDDSFSWAVDGQRHQLWHGGSSLTWRSDTGSNAWGSGDVIGLAVDLDAKTMSVSKNGEWQKEPVFSELAFSEFVYPAGTSGGGSLTFAFGQNSLKHAPPDSTYKAVASDDASAPALNP